MRKDKIILQFEDRIKELKEVTFTRIPWFIERTIKTNQVILNYLKRVEDEDEEQDFVGYSL